MACAKVHLSTYGNIVLVYLREGEVNPGDEDEIISYEKKIVDWKCDVVDGKSIKMLTKEEMWPNPFQLENSFDGGEVWL
jgi:hypothetical protein